MQLMLESFVGLIKGVVNLDKADILLELGF